MDDLAIVAQAQPTGMVGSVVETTGLLATVADLAAPVGSVVTIGARTRFDRGAVEGEVVGFRGRLTMVSPLGSLTGIRRGQPVRLVQTQRRLAVGDALLGRVVNANGEPIDGRARPALPHRVEINRTPHPALDRPPIKTMLPTGVRAIDAMLTCGRGQRLGVFAGSGVGKSTLLGMMTRYTAADVVVIGLVGERGREVNEFLERDLGPEGRQKSVVVVATSDEPAPMRLRAASTATSIAEHFRDQGRDVLLLVDSLTRTALASRELGLAAGEPPTTRGFPPSTFALLPKIVERAGCTSRGSITAFYSVLVEGDDSDEPIADCVRGLLDGHVWLSRKIAARGHFPAIDVNQSISRLMSEITPTQQQAAAQVVRRLLSALSENADLISIGAYRRGADPIVDAAIELRSEIDALLQQKVSEPSAPEQAIAALVQLANKAANVGAKPRPAAPAPMTTAQRK